MKVWLPYPLTRGGADIYCQNLAAGLKLVGWEPILDPHAMYWLYWPLPLQYKKVPSGTKIAIGLQSNWLCDSREG